MKRAQRQKGWQPKVRNAEMIAMAQRGGDGCHGGGKRQRNRRERQQFKSDLRRGEYL